MIRQWTAAIVSIVHPLIDDPTLFKDSHKRKLTMVHCARGNNGLAPLIAVTGAEFMHADEEIQPAQYDSNIHEEIF